MAKRTFTAESGWPGYQQARRQGCDSRFHRLQEEIPPDARIWDLPTTGHSRGSGDPLHFVPRSGTYAEPQVDGLFGVIELNRVGRDGRNLKTGTRTGGTPRIKEADTG